MVNRYIYGRHAEYQVKKFLEKHGAIYTTRTAGSHTAFDIIAVFPTFIMFLQVKRSKKLNKKEIRKVKEISERFPETAVTGIVRYEKGIKELHLFRKGEEIKFIDALVELKDKNKIKKRGDKV